MVQFSVSEKQRLILAKELLSMLSRQRDSMDRLTFPDAKLWTYTPPQTHMSDSLFGRGFMRVYTGHKSEYLSIMKTGEIKKSRLNMTWSQKIDNCLEHCASFWPN